MRERPHKLTLLAATTVLALSACSTTTSEPAAGSTVQLQADYPSYDTRSLIKEATLIVEGTVLATEPTVLTPRFEGDSPEENPLLGLSEEEKKRAIASDDGVAATAVTFRVDVLHRGVVKQGQKIIVIQTGGVIDGVNYHVEGEAMLAAGESYLLFATDSFDGAYAILGGSAGTYLSSRDGIFIAAAPEVAPSERFTTSEVASLTE
jgi:hypothetical protein